MTYSMLYKTVCQACHISSKKLSLSCADLISYNSVENLDNSNSSLVDNFDSFNVEVKFDSEWTKPVIDNYAPDLVAFRRFQEVLNPASGSGRSSPCSDTETPPSKGRLPLPSSTALNSNKSLLRKSKKFPAQKLVIEKTNLKPKTSGKTRSKLDSRTFGKTTKVTLPGKDINISPSNAMDYVRKITAGEQNSNQDMGGPRRRSRGAEPQTMHRSYGKVDLKERPNRKTSGSKVAIATRGDGKWSTDIDSAMNVPRRNSKQLSLDDVDVSW